MTRILILLPTTTYRAGDFLDAARRMNVEVAVASERHNTMESLVPDSFVTLDFRDRDASVAAVLAFDRKYPIDSVVAVDDDTAVIAAAVGAALSLKHNSVDSVLAARNKHLLSELLQRHSIPAPSYRLFALSNDPETSAEGVPYPCVLKPLFLSGSRGVIRADNPSEFVAAWKHISAILSSGELQARGGRLASQILVQEFIPGEEYALEGLLSNGKLQVLAIFDKPDPLVGPVFEETIYVTPSRREESAQRRMAECVSAGAEAIGLREGPVHAELRYNGEGPWLIELAARSIGGLCSRTLRFGSGYSLEDIILRHALGLPVDEMNRENQAAGVMMIPIPRSGILEEIQGLDEARCVNGILEVSITARMGLPIVALPEGSSYLGFIFAKGTSPSIVEESLRKSHSQLKISIRQAR